MGVTKKEISKRLFWFVVIALGLIILARGVTLMAGE